ncbi:MAG TPA: four helix bundle protein [Pirellulales bacterium]|jgi:four helix bundle protein
MKPTKIQSYRDLDVWQEGIQLALAVYRLTAKFPSHEQFGLVSQLRRCSVSVPSNIAEGHARLSTREYLRHVSIALGSLAELETQLLLAFELKYVGEDQSGDLTASADRLGKRLRSLTKSLRERIEREF